MSSSRTLGERMRDSPNVEAIKQLLKERGVVNRDEELPDPGPLQVGSLFRPPAALMDKHNPRIKQVLGDWWNYEEWMEDSSRSKQRVFGIVLVETEPEILYMPFLYRSRGQGAPVTGFLISGKHSPYALMPGGGTFLVVSTEVITLTQEQFDQLDFAANRAAILPDHIQDYVAKAKRGGAWQNLLDDMTA